MKNNSRFVLVPVTQPIVMEDDVLVLKYKDFEQVKTLIKDIDYSDCIMFERGLASILYKTKDISLELIGADTVKIIKR